MAIAAEALEADTAAPAARGWQAVSNASGQVRRVPAAARGAYGHVSSPSATAQTITKLIWAAAVGLIVLQIAAEATGQQWGFQLPGQASKPTKQPYQPLYTGQVSSAMPGVMPAAVAAPASVTSALPGATPGFPGPIP